MKETCILSSFLIVLLTVSAISAQSDLQLKAQKYFKPIPMVIPELKGNPSTPEKIELGKYLFFDPRLSRSALISCNTCHNIGMGGVDYQETSIGHGWQKGPRNAPTVLNSVFNIAQFWDGRAKDLAEQAKGSVQASVEMNNAPDHVIKTLKSMPECIVLFKKAFPLDTDPVTFDNMAKAIEVFEATLTTPDYQTHHLIVSFKATTMPFLAKRNRVWNCLLIQDASRATTESILVAQDNVTLVPAKCHQPISWQETRDDLWSQKAKMMNTPLNHHGYAISNLLPPIFTQAGYGASIRQLL